jgi:AraC-like DNA-binding protein
MKPVLTHYPVLGEQLFFATFFDFPFNPNPLHYHPEYELVYHIQGAGTRFIGGSLSEFNKGDLCLLGPNLPHLFRNHNEYYRKNSRLRHQSITIHFSPEVFGKDFFDLPVMKKLKQMLTCSRQGIDFTRYNNKALMDKLQAIPELNGLPRMLKLLEVLDELSQCSTFKLISGNNIMGTEFNQSERLELVIQYLHTHFAEEISLQQLAELACMTRTSTCRFFKERTKRSIWDFLAELRLNHAARLLRDTTATIVTISQESGFKNLSHFNRLFLAQFGGTPKNYRANMLAYKKDVATEV